MQIVAYTYLGEEDVLIEQRGDKFVVQCRRNLVPYSTYMRETLFEAEKVYELLLAVRGSTL